MPTKHHTSRAVMQSRVEPHTSLDYFPTPPWATRAACRFLEDEAGERLSGCSVWEPACGEGHMLPALDEFFDTVFASDVQAYEAPVFGELGHALVDFASPMLATHSADQVGDPDFIITNPPFRLALPFVQNALARARRGVCFVVRTSFVEGQERYREIFSGAMRPAYVATFSERVVMLRNRLIRDGALDPFNYNSTTYAPRRASTTTSYSLVMWLRGEHDTRHRWIAPCRRDFERSGDYPAYADQWAWLEEQQERGRGEAGALTYKGGT